MDTSNPLAKVTCDALDFIFGNEQRLVQLKRKTNLLKAHLLAKRLDPEECDLRDSLPAGMKKVLGSKRLVLWERLLRQEGYDDVGIVECMKRGVPLGTPDTPPCYDAKLTPATITEDQLRDNAIWRRKTLIAKPLSVADECFDPLEAACKEELEKGSVEGPFFSEDEDADYFASLALDISKRVADAANRPDLAKWFCAEVKCTLQQTPPRTLRLAADHGVLHLYVDGSWERGFAGLGAVLTDPSSGAGRVWQGVVLPAIISKWESEVGDHLICQIEVYAALCMRDYLKCFLKDRKLILWTDNDATRLCLVKGRSPSPSMHDMVKRFGRADVEHPCYLWVDRVPSMSNPADAPSTRHEHQMAMLEADRSFVFFLETGPHGMVGLLVQASQNWHQQFELGNIKQSLRSTLWGVLLMEWQARLEKIETDTQALQTTEAAGWISRSPLQWAYTEWHAEQRKALPSSRDNLTHDNAKKAVARLLKLTAKDGIVHRFQSLKPLKPELQAEVIVMLLTLTIHQHAAEIYEDLNTLANNSAGKIIGLRLRRERVGKSALAKELERLHI
ncbi:unnamed protein product [Symbiodinium sp. CCMP2592]|nr:unnamed protein product [Symbiodinium sp. CCMP2592]